MKVTAKLNYLRIAPRKVRLVADLIRRKKVEEAQTILDFTQKKATKPLLKLLKSAISNATHSFQLDPQNLYISKITVDEGPKYKRWMPRARGIAAEIQKKTSHITLVLDEIDEIAPEKKVKKIKKSIENKEIEKKDIKKIEKPKFQKEEKILKPQTARGLKRIFRRKAF